MRNTHGWTRALLLALVLLPAATLAGNTPLVPFKATYAVSLNGMPLGVELVLELVQKEGDNWKLAVSADDWKMHYIESSEFRWRDCNTDPLHYRYEFRGFGVDRDLGLDFDHAKHLATGEARRGPVSFVFPDDVNDEVSLSLAARCQLLNGAREVTYNVATLKGMVPWTYRVEGQEKLKTPWGKLDTIRVTRMREKGDKRKSTMWIAPALNHLLVKVEHQEKFGVRGYATIKTIEGITPPAAAR